MNKAKELGTKKRDWKSNAKSRGRLEIAVFNVTRGHFYLYYVSRNVQCLMSGSRRGGKERSRDKLLRRRQKAFSYIATPEGTEQGRARSAPRLSAVLRRQYTHR